MHPHSKKLYATISAKAFVDSLCLAYDKAAGVRSASSQSLNMNWEQ